MFWDKLFFPDQITTGFPNMYAALQTRGWPAASAMRGRIVFNLNLFNGNLQCMPIYWALPGASHAQRLAKSDGLALAADSKGAVIHRKTQQELEKGGAAALQWKRKVFFNRGTIADAKISMTTASMEVSAGTSRASFASGFITRFRVGNVPEDSAFIIAKHTIVPSTLVTYDGVWPG
jgi:hypothetical protein